jgi:drug/metabolite transporter (DMT)-like permease
LAAVNLMWAFQFSGVKFATETLGPLTVVVVTLLIGVLVLLPFLRFEQRRNTGASSAVWTRRIIILGIGAAVSQVGMTWGVERSLASNAAVLNLTIPVLTALFASVLIGERMTGLRWFSFVLALGGVAIVSANDLRSAELFSTRFVAGNLLIVTGCCGSAFYNTYSKVLLESFGPVRVMVYSFSAAAALLLPVAAAAEGTRPLRILELSWPAWSSLLAIAVFSLSLSMLLYLWVIDRIDVTQASLSIYMLPVFGVIISAVTLGEPVTWRLASGAVLVFASTFLVTIHEETLQRRRQSGVETQA